MTMRGKRIQDTLIFVILKEILMVGIPEPHEHTALKIGNPVIQWEYFRCLIQ
jgi:hypothetical protein